MQHRGLPGVNVALKFALKSEFRFVLFEDLSARFADFESGPARIALRVLCGTDRSRTFARDHLGLRKIAGRKRNRLRGPAHATEGLFGVDRKDRVFGGRHKRFADNEKIEIALHEGLGVRLEEADGKLLHGRPFVARPIEFRDRPEGHVLTDREGAVRVKAVERHILAHHARTVAPLLAGLGGSLLDLLDLFGLRFGRRGGRRRKSGRRDRRSFRRGRVGNRHGNDRTAESRRLGYGLDPQTLGPRNDFVPAKRHRAARVQFDQKRKTTFGHGIARHANAHAAGVRVARESQRPRRFGRFDPFTLVRRRRRDAHE